MVLTIFFVFEKGTFLKCVCVFMYIIRLEFEWKATTTTKTRYEEINLRRENLSQIWNDRKIIKIEHD